MNNKYFKIAALFLGFLGLTACSHMGHHEGRGALLGLIIGSTVGDAIGGDGLGLVGSFVGYKVGQDLGQIMDEADHRNFHHTRHVVLEDYPSGEEGTWYNPDTGHSGTFVAEPATEEGDRYCREFTQTLEINGKTEEAFGKACRQPDGTWKIENEG